MFHTLLGYNKIERRISMKINITDKAINELKKVLEKRKEAAKGVRVYMAGFG
ncbi:hypothetical protein L21TH_1671 [Caldisalinibacter kiritimatiensis]|uniref:Uncharacterized protein n=1 Tax=Caldisalinibacter kiritimatiensis TaxID=1304284 RepID=R1ASZ6_9FIRM|nr:hypothetical protein L21TH_1671 [Caldisalinibacter kiritimatiensis]